MKNVLNRLFREEEAATAVEYAIIAAIVGVALIASLDGFRESIAEMLDNAADRISGN
jgi:Flp pilus assembly pilin Flp